MGSSRKGATVGGGACAVLRRTPSPVRYANVLDARMVHRYRFWIVDPSPPRSGRHFVVDLVVHLVVDRDWTTRGRPAPGVCLNGVGDRRAGSKGEAPTVIPGGAGRSLISVAMPSPSFPGARSAGSVVACRRRRTPLDSAHGVCRSRSRAQQHTAGPTSRPGPAQGTPGRGWRRRAVARVQCRTQYGVDLGEQRRDIGIQMQDFCLGNADSVAARRPIRRRKDCEHCRNRSRSCGE